MNSALRWRATVGLELDSACSDGWRDNGARACNESVGVRLVGDPRRKGRGGVRALPPANGLLDGFAGLPARGDGGTVRAEGTRARPVLPVR